MAIRKYEYLTRICKADELQDTLNEYAEYGYELDNTIKEGDIYRLILRREN